MRRLLATSLMLVLQGSVCAHADQLPVDGPVTTSLAGKFAPVAGPSVLRVICEKDGTGGTGFVHSSGVVITAEHVVTPCAAPELRLIFSSGKSLRVKNAVLDDPRDLALLWPSELISVPTLKLSTAPQLEIGDQVATWGFPSGYSGLRPLLSVGYLSGDDKPKGERQQWVINAAFNSGNSGGPVIRLEDGAVIGVVSSKLAPLPEYAASSLEALSKMRSGMVFKGKNAAGELVDISEAQVVAQVLNHLREQTQLVLGYAVKLGELRAFLMENNISP